MNPAWSVVFFTTVAGTAQGLAVVLALAALGGVELAPAFLSRALLLAAGLSVAGLLSSFGHLGRKERAWRAVLMWRTSWLSRECIALPAFIGWLLLWWWMPSASPVLPAGAILLAAVLWVCTAMIYACLRFIEEWAQPMTLVNFVLIGLAGGLVLASALAALGSEASLLRLTGPAALVATLVAWGCRAWTVRRNATLRHRSTLQSATGIRAAKLVQKSMGMTGGAFNTREFFHGVSAAALRHVRLLLHVGGFALPAACALVALVSGSGPWASAAWGLAVVSQAVGLLADRWFFFAQAKHPQNLYYQVVS